MLNPSQFSPNEAWIFFKLNHAPVVTELDGEFDVYTLMDAASLYILSSGFIAAGSLDSADSEIRSLLGAAHSESSVWPEKILVSQAASADKLVAEARAIDVPVVIAGEAELSIFTNEARQEFRAHFGGGDLH